MGKGAADTGEKGRVGELQVDEREKRRERGFPLSFCLVGRVNPF
jgi:hypothetical protein